MIIPPPDTSVVVTDELQNCIATICDLVQKQVESKQQKYPEFTLIIRAVNSSFDTKVRLEPREVFKAEVFLQPYVKQLTESIPPTITEPTATEPFQLVVYGKKCEKKKK